MKDRWNLLGIKDEQGTTAIMQDRGPQTRSAAAARPAGEQPEGKRSVIAAQPQGQRHGIRPQARLPRFLSAGIIVDGRYRIESFLGTGGMCEVYRATHLGLMKPVALKMLRPRFTTDPHCIERFHREALAMSKLQHPNIVEVYGLGYFSSVFQTRPYIALELVEGTTLSEYAKQHRDQLLSRDTAVPIFMQICQALEHAHCKGIIHRDLKPANVMIKSDGRSVKVIDFGVAKILTDGGDVQRLTLMGETVGSVIYMSPEQCRGQEIDQRTDIYSMGCLMYEVLTGMPPLSGDTPYATMHKHLFEVPEVKPHLDNEFGTVVMNALAKNPQERPQSAKELMNALAQCAWATQAPKQSSRASTFYRAKPIFAAALAVLAAATIWLAESCAARLARLATPASLDCQFERLAFLENNF